MKFDPADFWDPRWRQWIAEGDERRERRRIVLNGRESLSETQWPEGVGIESGVVSVPIVLKRIGQPAAPAPGVCQCAPCIAGIPIFSNSQKEVDMKSEHTHALGVPGILSFGAPATMAKTSPFPDARKADIGEDGKGPGMRMKTANDADDSDDADSELAECCRTGTMEHLEGARAAIGREIQRRSGAAVLKFAK